MVESRRGRLYLGVVILRGFFWVISGFLFFFGCVIYELVKYYLEV